MSSMHQQMRQYHYDSLKQLWKLMFSNAGDTEKLGVKGVGFAIITAYI